MHRSNTYLRRAVAVSLLGTMSTLNACSTPAPTASVARLTTHATYDGESLFRGIFFGEGAIGKSLSDVWQNGSAEAALTSPEQIAKLHRFESVVIAGFRSSDPAFFGRFATAVQSGDYMVVQSAIDEAASKLEASARAYVASTRDGNAAGDGVVVNISVAAAGVVVIVAAAVVVITLVARRHPGAVVTATSDDALGRDMLVNAIVVHLTAGGQVLR